MTSSALNDFPLQSTDKVRYADTDRQGHINNSIFCQFLETARAELVYSFSPPLIESDSEFVIASLVLEFKGEIRWPGSVQVGTKVSAVGSSSTKLEQVIFQDDRCVATAQSVIVCIDSITRQPRALSSSIVSILSSYMTP